MKVREGEIPYHTNIFETGRKKSYIFFVMQKHRNSCDKVNTKYRIRKTDTKKVVKS